MYSEILNYQKKEKELIDLEKSLSQSDERRRVVKARGFLQDVDKNIKDMDDKAAALNASFAALKDRIEALSAELEEYNALLGKSKDEAEINYFVKKVQKLDEELSAAENSASKIINDVKALLLAFDEYKKKVKSAKEEFEKYKQKYDELKKSRQADFDEIKAELNKIAKSVPASEKDVFDRYKKVREKKIYPAIVAVNGNNCGGCRMELSMNMISKLKEQHVIECEECGRIIYMI